MVDPIVISAVRSAEVQGNVIFDSPGLRLIGITPCWKFALKLQRYSKMDEHDIICLLERDGACGDYPEGEFVEMVEEQLKEDCPVMDYGHYPPKAKEEWKRFLYSFGEIEDDIALC